MHLISGVFPAENVDADRATDSEPNERKPITNQGRYTNLKYGKSNVGKTGCIPIAIYNVLVLRAARVARGGMAVSVELPDFNNILESVRVHKAPLLGGYMGTDPFMIDEILSEYGVKSVEITTKKALEEEMRASAKGTLFLITQWNDIRRPLKGVHAYVVEKHTDDRWACYNLVYRDYPTRATDLESMLGRGKLIVANRIL